VPSGLSAVPSPHPGAPGGAAGGSCRRQRSFFADGAARSAVATRPARSASVPSRARTLATRSGAFVTAVAAWLLRRVHTRRPSATAGLVGLRVRVAEPNGWVGRQLEALRAEAGLVSAGLATRAVTRRSSDSGVRAGLRNSSNPTVSDTSIKWSRSTASVKEPRSLPVLPLPSGAAVSCASAKTAFKAKAELLHSSSRRPRCAVSDSGTLRGPDRRRPQRPAARARDSSRREAGVELVLRRGRKRLFEPYWLRNSGHRRGHIAHRGALLVSRMQASVADLAVGRPLGTRSGRLRRGRVRPLSGRSERFADRVAWSTRAA
jgi:hypothetical protein